MRADPAQARADAVELAAGAQARGGGEQGEAGHQQSERPAECRQPGRVRDGRRAEDDDADHVREARRPGVLDRPLAEARLHELEVGEAREAVPPAEGEADRELEREDGQEGPPARDHGHQSEQPDRRLVEARPARVDDVEVAVRIGRASTLHL